MINLILFQFSGEQHDSKKVAFPLLRSSKLGSLRPSIFQANTLNSVGEEKPSDDVTENKNPFLKFCDHEEENHKACDDKTTESEEVRKCIIIGLK